MNVGKVLGFEVRLDLSWFVVFALVVASLLSGQFPRLFDVPGGSPGWVLAVLGSLLLFASVLAHELAHSVVGRRLGMRIEGITLFIFGGMARLKDEPRSAASELWMTLAGPATSAALAILFFGAGYIGMAYHWPAGLVSVLGYLAFANGILAVFNLIPAFPLDGGRILRAALWAVRRDVVVATRWSANVSRAIAFGLMGLGALEIGAGNFGGVWLFFLGMFVVVAATAAYQQTWLRARLEGVTVASLLGPEMRPVAAATPLNLVHDIFHAHPDGAALLVMDGDTPRGLLSPVDMAAWPERQWPWTTAMEAAQPLTEETAIEDGDDAWQAFTHMLKSNAVRVLVTHNGRVRGILTRDRMVAFLRTK